MGLSSNIIWHQTDIKGFNAILKSRCLMCSYSLETFLDKDQKIAFPMISLSDIAVADIKEYMGQYDGYLIGFSREWVIKNGFNPVWYCEKNNQALNAHKKKIYHDSCSDDNVNRDAALLALQYGAYIKDIEGPLHVKSKNKTYSNYRFYDEREYRYVPDFNDLLSKGIMPCLLENDYNEYKKIKGNSLIQSSIPFTLADIKMLIVQTDKQAIKLKQKLKNISQSIHVFSQNEIKQSIIGIGHQIDKEKK